MSATSNAQVRKSKLGKLHFVKVRNYCDSKDIIKRAKSQLIERGKFLQIIYLKMNLRP